jgi:2-hydroxychromene-2-carboxylate isomerase
VPAKPLRFLFDTISPYSWLAWTRIHALAARHGRQVEPVPVLLAALLDQHGQLGPGEIPAKRRYVFRDVLRSASHLGVDLSPPPAHPFNPLLSLRIASLDHADADERFAVVDALFEAVWGGGPGVTDPDALSEFLNGRGLDGPGLIARAAAPEAKSRLRAATDAALSAGVFGVPTVLDGDEMFWGFDSFDHLDRYLANGRSYDRSKAQTWDKLEAQAVRSRAPR